MRDNESFADEQRDIDESKKRVIQALRLAATAIRDVSDDLRSVWWLDLRDPIQYKEIQEYRAQAWTTVSDLLGSFSKTVEGLSTADIILDHLFDGFRRKCEAELQTLALRNNLRVSLIERARLEDQFRQVIQSRAASSPSPS